MTARRRVWLLNLDAEIEIEGRRPYADPFAALTARPELERSLVSDAGFDEGLDDGASLVPRGDDIVRVQSAGGAFEGAHGHAWCLTATARRTLERVGAVVSKRPSPEVLARVSSRAFSASLGTAFEQGRFFIGLESWAEIERALARGERWLARRAFGFAGRGRRVVGGRVVSEAELAFMRRALSEGGLLLEPYVQRVADYSLHGFVRGAEIVLGEPTRTEVDGGGVWRGSRRTDRSDLREVEREALYAEATRAAVALDGAGYEGPFGVDAFRYALDSRERFCARCEINARYSMGWAIGMGHRRPDLAG